MLLVRPFPPNFILEIRLYATVLEFYFVRLLTAILEFFGRVMKINFAKPDSMSSRPGMLPLHILYIFRFVFSRSHSSPFLDGLRF